MGEGHSNTTGHGARGPTGGVKGGSTGFGGGNPNSGKGWGVSQTPYGPLRNYNPSKFGSRSGGNRGGNNRSRHRGNPPSPPNLAQRPELQVAIVPGVAVPLSLVAGEWGFTLLKPKVVAAALDLALTRMAMFAVDAAPYVGRFAGVVGMLLAPSEIAKDDMSVTRRTVVTLPAERIISVPLAQLPTQSAVVANVRLHDVVQDGVQKIAVVKSKHVPITVPVVQAKPTDRTGVFTAQILNGMPPIHIHIDTSSSPPTATQPSGIREVRDSPVTPVFSPLGSNSHDAIVYFPAEANTDPVYISVTTVLIPEQIKQVEEENRQKQAQWDAKYPQVQQALFEKQRAIQTVAEKEAILHAVKETAEGKSFLNPEKFPMEEYLIAWFEYSKTTIKMDISINSAVARDYFLQKGPMVMYPLLYTFQSESQGEQHARDTNIATLERIYRRLTTARDNINQAQHELNTAKNEVNNADQHIQVVRAQLVEAEARWIVEAPARQRVERERLAAAYLARQQAVTPQNTFSLPAHPPGGAHSPSFAAGGAGAITLSPQVANHLGTSLRRVSERFRSIDTSSLADPMAVIIGTGFYSDNDREGANQPPLVGSFSLRDIGLSLGAPLLQQGDVDSPVRILMAQKDDWTGVYAVKTQAANVAAKVKVGQAQLDRSKGVYTFTTDSQPPRTFIFTPAKPPGMDISSVLPQPPSAPVVPSHTGADITFLATKPSLIFLALEEGDFHDYIIWFPAASGLEPVYIYLKTPRDEPGEVTGRGQQVAGVWLAEAGKGLGAPIPVQIADKLRGRKFSSFGEFRRALWLEISKDPTLSEQFKSGNLGNIKNGKAPSPRESEQVGGRVKHELHHVQPISKGGAVYDIDNIRVLTPKRHIKIHKEVK
ncbi:colicin-like bacteriocin tRNase domain-containing protein [Yersinia sp. 2541 StPb PI]|uniref:colicin-like bacteriocin tRNase domain-containing protein n=1 Tax=Yersinia sp. 2541 StPb PI TaxID=3117407 RepID=UPI003FA4343D